MPNRPQDSPPAPGILVRWVGWVHRRAALVAAGAVLATAAAGYHAATNLGINTDTTDMLSEELPFRVNDAAMTAAFPQFSDVLSIVVESPTPDRAADAAAALAAGLRARPRLFGNVLYFEGHPFFRRHGLLFSSIDDLQILGDRLADAEPLLAALKADMSLRGLSNVLSRALGAAGGAGGAGADSAAEMAGAMEPILRAVADTVRSVAAAGEGRLRTLSWVELMRGKQATPEDKRRFILAQPVLDYATLEPAAAAIAAVRGLAADLGLSAETGVRVRMTGSPVMFQDELRSVRDGIGLVGLLSVALVASVLVLGLRAPRLVAATLATLVMGLVWTTWFATAAVGDLNLISVAFAVLFIGLAVDFGVHFVLRYQEAVNAKGEHAARSGAALAEAAAGVGGPLTICAVAAAMGFFSFLPTSYRGLSELGLISGVGMFIALFANLTALPAILALLPTKPRPPPAGGRAARRPPPLANRPRLVVAVALGLGVAALATVPLARFDDDPLNLRDPESESMATLRDLISDQRANPYRASILTGGIPAALELASRLEELPEVEAVATLMDLVPDDQEQKLEILDEMSLFLTPVFQSADPAPPPSADEQRRALRALEAGLARVEGEIRPAADRLADALGRLDRDDGTLAVVEAALLAGLPARLDALSEALEAGPVTPGDLPADLRAQFLAADGRVRIEVSPRHDLRDAEARRRFVAAVSRVAPAATGLPITISQAGEAVVQALAEAAAYAAVLVTLLLLVLLRGVRDALLVLAPLALAAALTVAATVAFGIPFNFANVIVLPLLFGLGVAGGIHIVARARAAGAAGLMATSTPRAVLLSALTTIGSFGALAVSSHRGMASMGVLLTIAITLTMLSTLVVLPALLSLTGNRGSECGIDRVAGGGDER